MRKDQDSSRCTISQRQSTRIRELACYAVHTSPPSNYLLVPFPSTRPPFPIRFSPLLHSAWPGIHRLADSGTNSTSNEPIQWFSMPQTDRGCGVWSGPCYLQSAFFFIPFSCRRPFVLAVFSDYCHCTLLCSYSCDASCLSAYLR